MISTAMSTGWAYDFLGHQDVIVMGREEQTPFRGFYDAVLEILSRLKETMGPEAGDDMWVVAYYSYDWLTLINVDAMVIVGAWDIFIPYYASDCDSYERMYTSGLKNINHIPSPLNPERSMYWCDITFEVPGVASFTRTVDYVPRMAKLYSLAYRGLKGQQKNFKLFVDSQPIAILKDAHPKNQIVPSPMSRNQRPSAGN